MAIPFKNFRRLSERIPPRAGDMWRLNLNRTAGHQGKFSLWSDTHAPQPAFHHAVYFGKVFFSSELVKKRCKCEEKTPGALK